VESVADEEPFAALRLLQVCGVERFGHIISEVPPPLVSDFDFSRDDVVTATFIAIQHEPPSQDSTRSLLVGTSGAALTSIARHAASSYLGAFFQVAGLLFQRLVAMGGNTNRSVATILTNPCRLPQPNSGLHMYATRTPTPSPSHSFTVAEHTIANS
jgi:hypothetical protein